MATPLTILISSAGRRVELINCFHEAARDLDCDLRVVATDANPAWSAACQHVDRSYQLPRCSDPGFLLATLEICQREKVGLLIPTIDPELAGFAGFRAEFEAVGTQLAVSAPEVVALARNKLETNRFFRRIGVGAPRTALLREVVEEITCDPGSWRFPVVAKPIDGSASVGLRMVPSVEALRALEVNGDRYVVQNRAQGQEYTLNLYFDRAGLRCAAQHRRVEMRGGEVSKGITERVPGLTAAAERIGEALAGKAYGVLNCQAILPAGGEPQLLEMNARLSGGYPLVHRAGGKFARWLMEAVLGRRSTANNDWKEGIAMLRYDAAYFVEPAASGGAGKR